MVMLSLVFLVAWFIAIVISYLVVTVLVWFVCLAFGFTFTWTLSLGIWALLVLFKTITRDFRGK